MITQARIMFFSNLFIISLRLARIILKSYHLLLIQAHFDEKNLLDIISRTI